MASTLASLGKELVGDLGQAKQTLPKPQVFA